METIGTYTGADRKSGCYWLIWIASRISETGDISGCKLGLRLGSSLRRW
jgi:hypothetical protein